MAITYKRFTSNTVGTTLVTVGSYTVPSATKTTVVGLNLCNMHTADVSVTVSIANTTANTCIVRGAKIPVNNALNIMGAQEMKTIVLDVGDKIQLQCNTASGIDAYLSIVEHT